MAGASVGSAREWVWTGCGDTGQGMEVDGHSAANPSPPNSQPASTTVTEPDPGLGRHAHPPEPHDPESRPKGPGLLHDLQGRVLSPLVRKGASPPLALVLGLNSVRGPLSPPALPPALGRASALRRIVPVSCVFAIPAPTSSPGGCVCPALLPAPQVQCRDNLRAFLELVCPYYDRICIRTLSENPRAAVCPTSPHYAFNL